MSFSHGNDAELKIQNAAGTLVDISTYLTSISMPREIEANETSTMRIRDRTYVPGLRGRTVSFEGRDVSGLGRSQLRGYYAHVQGVFQDPFSSYNPVYKVDRVLGMVRASYLPELSASEWREKLDGSLRAVSLEPADVLGKFPHQLSGGQLQRLMIARALLLDLRFLVADEIISMLDASTRIDVLNLLGDLKQRGVGVLFITHDLSLGNYISDRTVILRRGRVVESGNTTKVFGNPQHPYTQALLSAVPHLRSRWGAERGATHTPLVRSIDAAGPLTEIEPDHLVALDEHPDAAVIAPAGRSGRR